MEINIAFLIQSITETDFQNNFLSLNVFLELNPLNGNTENRAVNSADMHKVANAR